MSENFDPVRIDLVTGETIVDGDVNTVQVVDPDGHPNRVLDPDEDFNINVEWHIEGTNGYQMATGAEAAGGVGWRVMAYGESMGPGPELELGTKFVPVAAFDSQDADGKTSYKAEVLVPAGTLKEHLEGGASGVYKIVVVVFLNWPNNIPGGEDLVGFRDERLILAESLK